MWGSLVWSWYRKSPKTKTPTLDSIYPDAFFENGEKNDTHNPSPPSPLQLASVHWAACVVWHALQLRHCHWKERYPHGQSQRAVVALAIKEIPKGLVHHVHQQHHLRTWRPIGPWGMEQTLGQKLGVKKNGKKTCFGIPFWWDPTSICSCFFPRSGSYLS